MSSRCLLGLAVLGLVVAGLGCHGDMGGRAHDELDAGDDPDTKLDAGQSMDSDAASAAEDAGPDAQPDELDAALDSGDGEPQDASMTSDARVENDARAENDASTADASSDAGCQLVCAPDECGTVDDGCGGTLDCGSCGPPCVGPLCEALPTSCTADSPTRLTGTVRTPGILVAGSWLNRLPVPHATVYITATPGLGLPEIFEGVKADDPASCVRCDSEALVLDGDTVLARGVTDYKGDFVLEGRVPVGEAFELVVVSGKWRRVVEVPADVAVACDTRSLEIEYTRLPAHSEDGLAGTHLPQIAVSTGDVDALECVLLDLGIAQREFTVPAGGGRVHMYRANGQRMRRCDGSFTQAGVTRQCADNENAGCINNRSGCTWTNISAADTTLYASDASLSRYDMVLFDCEGEGHYVRSAEPRSRVRRYVDAGGRVFASHWSYEWLDNNGDLEAAASWTNAGSATAATAYVSLPEGPTMREGANPVLSPLFRDWLDYQGTLVDAVPGQLSMPDPPRVEVFQARDVAGDAVGPATDEWTYREVSHCSNREDRVCSDDSGCRVCDNNNTRFCTSDSGCLSGGLCVAGGTCDVTKPSVQQLSFNTPYGAEDEALCGRVAFSALHVTTDSGADLDTSSQYFPNACGRNALTDQEKVLAFMLLDLGSCIEPR